MRAKPHSNYQYWRRTVNEQNQGTILHGRQSLLKISGQNLKNRYFEHVYVCDVTWWCHNSKTKKIWNQPAKSFHMRYHTTLSDFRIKFCRFSDHYDVTMRVFPEWVTSSKVGPFLNKDPCQVSSKSLEPFFNKTDLTLKTYFFEISTCCYDVTMRAKPQGNH